MGRLGALIIFLSIGTAILGGIHFYFWMRLVRDPGWPPGLRWSLTALLVLLAGALPAAFIIGRQVEARWSDFLVWPAFSWMGGMFILLVVLAGADLAFHLASLLARSGWDVQLLVPQRLLAARVLAVGSVAIALVLGTIALVRAQRPPAVKNARIELDRLPEAFDGFRIVQISDVHVGPTVSGELISHVVDEANALEPDLIAITGDLVDGGVGELRDAIEPLGRLHAPHGVFFVTGNHEYYAGVEEWLNVLRRMGVRVLRNERVTISQDGASFVLAGVDDSSARRLASGHGADVAKALSGYDRSMEVILLAHQPKEIDEAAEYGVGLQISGHTHGGQIWPFNFLVHLAQPYVSGYARHGGTQLYVSEGTGYWGPPMRLGTTSEMGVIELVAKRDG